jgi:hypothetical protein
VISIRAAVLYSKVSHFSDGLAKYSRPRRRCEGACGGVQVQRHPFRTSALDGVSGQVHVVTAVLLGKHPRCTLNSKPVGPQSWSRKSGKFINFSLVLAVEQRSLRRRARSVATRPTTLSRLHVHAVTLY